MPPIIETIRNVFIEREENEQEELSLNDIRRRILGAKVDIQTSSAQAAKLERQAHEALQKTFEPGISAAEQARRRAQHQHLLQQARTYIAGTTQLGQVLETLESAETFLELSEVVADCNIPGTEKMNLQDIMRELQDAQAVLATLSEECSKIRNGIDVAVGAMGVVLQEHESKALSELDELYRKLSEETDPVKRASIEAQIREKSDPMNLAMMG